MLSAPEKLEESTSKDEQLVTFKDSLTLDHEMDSITISERSLITYSGRTQSTESETSELHVNSKNIMVTGQVVTVYHITTEVNNHVKIKPEVDDKHTRVESNTPPAVNVTDNNSRNRTKDLKNVNNGNNNASFGLSKTKDRIQFYHKIKDNIWKIFPPILLTLGTIGKCTIYDIIILNKGNSNILL